MLLDSAQFLQSDFSFLGIKRMNSEEQSGDFFPLA